MADVDAIADKLKDYPQGLSAAAVFIAMNWPHDMCAKAIRIGLNRGLIVYDEAFNLRAANA